GEDVVKLGKLNLVDLAGSESIGRSGAQNDNAHEAGKINQSLLVLGRVISALGAKAAAGAGAARDARVPYRDSKLTHILKDSLGGRTRTCMIATISNSTDSIEVTTSTLQYASQARGIRNRPVANRKVSKSDILHDMQHQMEQLQRDLDAARDGEGFFITRESYGELAAQAQAAKEVADEWKQRVALWELETQRVTAQHDELARAHAATEARLRDREQALDAAQADAARARGELGRQALLTRAHALHEDALDAAARTLRGSLGAAAADARGLQAKLARMADGEQRTLAAVGEIGALVDREAAAVVAAVGAHGARADQQTRQLVAGLRERAGAPLDDAVRGELQRLAERATAQIAEAVAAAGQAQTAAQADHSRSVGAVADVVAGLHRAVGGLAAQAADECAAFVGEARRTAAEHEAALAAAAADVSRLVGAGVRTAAAALEQAQAQARDAIAALAADADALRAAHDAQLGELRAAIAALHADAQREDAELAAAVAAMLAKRRARTETAAAAVADAAQEHAAARETRAAAAVAQMRTLAAAADEATAAAGTALHAAAADVDQRLDAALTAQAAASAAQTERAASHAAGVERQLRAIGPDAVGPAQQQATEAAQQAQQAAER
ncbi:Kinesin- motor protein, partial [Coemansia nantahalensis]